MYKIFKSACDNDTCQSVCVMDLITCPVLSCACLEADSCVFLISQCVLHVVLNVLIILIWLLLCTVPCLQIFPSAPCLIASLSGIDQVSHPYNTTRCNYILF